ncbi:MAG: mercury(II) reductase [Proteobacteria bacterium]|nr:mercury(II) reductase [Pseudomonadota bacterium]
MTGGDCCSSSSKGEGGTFDLAVIGAGSAGFSAAITGAELGAQVALIGHGVIGGTCVNVGCVPSKALIRAADSLHQARAASRFSGITAEARLDDWRALIAQKDDLVAGLRQAKYIDILPSYNTIAYMEGPASIEANGIAVNGDMIRAGKIIVATGSSPFPPPIPGIGDVPYLTSTTAMELDRLPESMLVIGGGDIGVELAQMFQRAGVRVTVVCRSRLLPQAEPEIAQALTDVLKDEGLDVIVGAAYGEIKQGGPGVALSLTVEGESRMVEAEKLLVAAGRSPNSAGLGLEDAGVGLSKSGAIEVDEYLRTSNHDIFAAGDVTGRDMLVYMAAYGARLAATNALNGGLQAYDATAMPAVTFTDPQAASVGLTERRARDQGIDVKTSVLPLEHVPRALAARDTRGLIKLVADSGTDKLLGAHILAAEGGEGIQTAALAIKHGMTVTELAETIFPYLTTVEGLKLAALAFDKDVTKLSCCAG